jgi:hypothetical protein
MAVRSPGPGVHVGDVQMGRESPAAQVADRIAGHSDHLATVLVEQRQP